MPKRGSDGNVDEVSTPEKSPRSGNKIYLNYYKHSNPPKTQTHKLEKIQQNQQKLPVLMLISHLVPTFHSFLGGDEFGSVEDLDEQDVTIQSESEEEDEDITHQPGGSQGPQGTARTNGNFDTGINQRAHQELQGRQHRGCHRAIVPLSKEPLARASVIYSLTFPLLPRRSVRQQNKSVI